MRPSGGRSRERGGSPLASVVEIVVIVCAALVLALLIQRFAVKSFWIPSGSMEPTLTQGDRVLVSRFSYWFSEPKPGDVVVFRPPSAPTEEYIKRVVAVGGDTVEVRDGRLIVDGVVRDEAYLKDAVMAGQFKPVTVPPGSFFVMGDNRNDSGDSRMFGPVAGTAILGKAFFTYWPLNRLHTL
jgi:signal peptidase I